MVGGCFHTNYMKPLDEQRDKSEEKQPHTKITEDKLRKKYSQHLKMLIFITGSLLNGGFRGLKASKSVFLSKNYLHK